MLREFHQRSGRPCGRRLAIEIVFALAALRRSVDRPVTGKQRCVIKFAGAGCILATARAIEG